MLLLHKGITKLVKPAQICSKFCYNQIGYHTRSNETPSHAHLGNQQRNKGQQAHCEARKEVGRKAYKMS